MGFVMKPLQKTFYRVGDGLQSGMKKIGGWFAPDMPAMPEVKTATEADPSVQAAADAERKRMRNARGRAATMLTGSQGADLGSNAGTTKLLGG